jgi:hypothetical protein
MKGINHIIYIPFTGLGKFDGFRGQDWYKYRLQIFKKFTLQSLKEQKSPFILWISFRPQEKNNPITKEIETAVQESGIKYVFTFDGLMYHDDRNQEVNKTILDRLKKSLKLVSKVINKKNEFTYITVASSDDMWANDLTKIIQSKKYVYGGALFHRKGYVYNSETKELADWYNPESIGFYTIYYTTENFLDAEKHLFQQGNLLSHELVHQIYISEEMPDDKYCCVVHGRNISTIWEHPYKGKQYFYEKDKKRILKNFNSKL